MKHRRDKHSIKMDQANHMQELEEEKPSKGAEEAFRRKPYQTMSVMEYLEKLRRGADGQGDAKPV